MESKISFLLMVIALSYLSYIDGAALNESLNLCPKESDAKDFVGGVSVAIVGQETAKLVRRLRLPQIGLYNHPLSCILVTDTSADDSGGEVEITDGGIGHRYAEIKLTSKIGHGLDYIVFVYSAA